mgnify:CR=1 FL=1
MAKDAFVKPTPAGEYPLGHAKENKDASAYTGFKYPSGGGNDIGIYKQPMNLPNENINFTEDPNSLKAQQIGKTSGTPRVSMGDPTKPTKTDGITMRGYGAATKGIKSRGPMA